MKTKKIKGWVAAIIIGIASIPLVIVLIIAAIENINSPSQKKPEDVQTNASGEQKTTKTPTPKPEDDGESPYPTRSPDYLPAFAGTPTPMAAVQATPSPTPIPALGTPKDISRGNTELRAQLESLAAEYKCKAVSIAYFDSNGEFFVFYTGEADSADGRMVNPDTKFRVGSLSNIIPVICAMRLAQDGFLDLDEDISIFLGYPVANPDYPQIPITARMLMQHTSSIYDSDIFISSRNQNAATNISIRDLLTAGAVFRNTTPGVTCEYSNFGVSVLAAVCEMITGRLIDTIARDIIFTPLGIDAAYIPANLNDTTNIAAIYNVAHILSRSVQTQLNTGSSGVLGRDHHLAQGNLTISAKDLARVLAMLCSDGTLGSKTILSQQSVRNMHNADVTGASYMQGFGVRYQHAAKEFFEENIYWNTGGMYGELTQFVYSIETGQIAVILTTGGSGKRLDNGMIEVCTQMAKTVWR